MIFTHYDVVAFLYDADVMILVILRLLWTRYNLYNVFKHLDEMEVDSNYCCYY